MQILIFPIGNHFVLELQGLRSVLAAPGAYENDATVTVTLRDLSGQAVSGQSWPAPMTFVPSSNGDYRATLDADLALIENAEYRATVDVLTAGGIIGRWEPRCIAKPRRV